MRRHSWFSKFHATGWVRSLVAFLPQHYHQVAGRKRMAALRGHFHFLYNPATKRYGVVPDNGAKWVIEPGDNLERREDGRRAREEGPRVHQPDAEA